MAKRGLTRPGRNIRWIETYCCVPEGKDVGKPVKLRPWQKKEIERIYGSPTRRAIISFGRKNGKSALASFLLLLHLCGPEAKENSQLYSAAQSREQAAILFNLAAKCVRMSPDLNAVVIIRDTAKELVCAEIGTKYRALSADATTAFGLSPVFTVHDELGQVKGPRSELYEALETGSGAHEEPLSIVISTQAPTDGDLLSILIDDAVRGGDPEVKVSLYTADPDLDPFSKEAIQRANPAFGDFQSAKETLALAEDARRMPSREPEFRNLILNQRVEMNSPFISRSTWQSCGGEVSDDWGNAEVWAGLDLSATNDLTAFVPIAWIEDAWEVRPTFWLPAEGLREKSRTDRVPYDMWAADGQLQTTPGRAVEYEFVAAFLYGFCSERGGRVRIAFDRWNMKHLRPWLLRAGFTEEQIEAVFVEFGQGFVSMSPALRDTESALLTGKVRHGNHPVLSMCAANAVVTMDPAGNRKLNKQKSATRIDGMVALAMAFGIAPNEVEPAPAYELMIISEAAMQNRAYSILEVKSVDEDKRVIRGVATTPTVDRVGDIIEPDGVQFKNPMPLLWQHKHDQPIGHTVFGKPTKSGIPFEAEFVHPDAVKSESLKDRLQMAWDSVKTQLVRAVSIGFRPIEYSFMDSGGIRYTETEVYELSAVTIPANADAVISTVKSLDAAARHEAGVPDPEIPAPPEDAAPGKQVRVVKLDAPARDRAKPFVIRQIKRAGK